MTLPLARPPFRSTLALLLAVGAVLGLRLWHLGEMGAPDYDSVENWRTVQALAAGDGKLLFHHAAPGFMLLFVPVAWATSSFQVFQYLHAVVAVMSLGIFGRFMSRAGQLGPAATAAVVLLAGTSLLLTFSGSDFTENALSLGAASGLMASYFERLHTRRPAALLRSMVWLAAGLCFSFKLLFVVPILGALEWWAADGLLKQQGTWWRALAIIAAPYLVLGAIGVAVGLPWFRWPAIYYRSIFPKAPNLAGDQQKIHLEALFYLRYLLGFEPNLLLGLVLGGLVWRRQLYWRRGQPLHLGPYLLVWAGCLLLVLTLLAKAPRALLFAHAPLAGLLVLSIQRLLPRQILGAVALAAALGLNLYILQRELFSRFPTRYPLVAAWLRAHHAERIGSTVGVGLRPFLAPNQQLALVTKESQLAALRRQGYQYVLLDSYWRAAGVVQFDSLRRQPPVAAWPEPQLTAPLLFLEHAEYTGLSYDQTLAAQRAAASDSLQLRLYRL